MPGRRKTTRERQRIYRYDGERNDLGDVPMCENGFMVGRVKTKDVGDTAEVGIVIQGAPAGMTPKSWGMGSAMFA